MLMHQFVKVSMISSTILIRTMKQLLIVALSWCHNMALSFKLKASLTLAEDCDIKITRERETKASEPPLAH